MSNTDDRHSSIFPTQGDETHHGLSKLEYFAARAPKNIPEWFQHKEREKPKHPEYSCLTDEAILIEGWRKDPCYDLPKNLQRFQKMYEEYWDALEEWGKQDHIDRMIQWPWFWAQAVLDGQQEQSQVLSKELPDLDSQEFNDLMSMYRMADMADQETVIRRFEAVKDFIRGKK